MKIQIRAACEADMGWLCERLKLHASSAYQVKRPFFQDEKHTHSFMMTLIKEHVVLVAESDEPVGFIGGILQPSVYDPSLKMLSSAFYWVEPEHRQSRAAAALLSAFIDWGKRCADWLFIGLPPQSNISDRAMTKRGFSLKERLFLLEVG